MGNPESQWVMLVIVHEEGLPRGFWKLGRIQALILGRDGKPRGAVVGIAGKNRCFTSLNRPLQLLYPLEINHSPELIDCPQETREPENKETQESEKQDKSTDQPICQPRPKRIAARKGEEKRRLWTCELQD